MDTIFRRIETAAIAILGYCLAIEGGREHTTTAEWLEGRQRIQRFLDDVRTEPSHVDWLVRMNAYIEKVNLRMAGKRNFVPVRRFEEQLKPLVEWTLPLSDENRKKLQKAALECNSVCVAFEYALREEMRIAAEPYRSLLYIGR